MNERNKWKLLFFKDGVLLLLPVLPSSRIVRICIVMTVIVFRIPFKYWSWKQHFLNKPRTTEKLDLLEQQDGDYTFM